jgi:hypothetical protein
MSAESRYSRIEAYNKDVEAWGTKVSTSLKSSVQGKATKGKGKLAAGIKPYFHEDYSEIDSISYKFPRHGVFFAKGVGRGHIMQSGKVVRGIKHGKIATLTGGPVNRKPQDWFNHVIDKNIENLIDTVAEHKADTVLLNASGMKIK